MRFIPLGMASLTSVVAVAAWGGTAAAADPPRITMSFVSHTGAGCEKPSDVNVSILNPDQQGVQVQFRSFQVKGPRAATASCRLTLKMRGAAGWRAVPAGVARGTTHLQTGQEAQLVYEVGTADVTAYNGSRDLPGAFGAAWNHALSGSSDAPARPCPDEVAVYFDLKLKLVQTDPANQSMAQVASFGTVYKNYRWTRC